MLDGIASVATLPLGRLRRGWTPWPALVGLLLILAVAGGVRYGGFSPKVWPWKGLAALDREPTRARLFHEQDWGGMIAAECRPRRRAFLDDRFELFGRRAILDYVDALQGGPGWDALRVRERIDLVWVRPDRGLARRLAADPGWRRVHEDELSVLYERREPPETPGGRLAGH